MHNVTQEVLRMVPRLQYVSLFGVFALVCCGYIAPQDRRYLDYFLKLYSAKLFQKNNCSLISSSAVVSRQSIEKVEMVLTFYRVLPREQARELLVSVAEALVDAINSDEELIKRGLISRPFTVDQLILEIRTDNLYSANADVDAIRQIRLKSGIITYDRYLWSSILSAGSESFSEEYQYAMMLVGLPTTYDPRTRAEKYRIQNPELAPFEGVASAGELAGYKNPELCQRIPRPKPQAPKAPQNVMISCSNALDIVPDQVDSVEGTIEWVTPMVTKQVGNQADIAVPKQPIEQLPAPESAPQFTSEPDSKPASAPELDSLIEEAVSAIDRLFPSSTNQGKTIRQRIKNDEQRVWKEGAQEPSSFKAAKIPAQLIPLQGTSLQKPTTEKTTPSSAAPADGVPEQTSSYFFQERAQPFVAESITGGLFENEESSVSPFSQGMQPQQDFFEPTTAEYSNPTEVAGTSSKRWTHLYAPIAQCTPDHSQNRTHDSLSDRQSIHCEALAAPLLEDRDVRPVATDWKYLALTSAYEGVSTSQTAEISHSVYPSARSVSSRSLPLSEDGAQEQTPHFSTQPTQIQRNQMSRDWGYVPANLQEQENSSSRAMPISTIVYPSENSVAPSKIAVSSEGAHESFVQGSQIPATTVRDWGYLPVVLAQPERPATPADKMAMRDGNKLIAEVEPQEEVQDDPEMPSEDSDHEPTGFSDLSNHFSFSSSSSSDDKLLIADTDERDHRGVWSRLSHWWNSSSDQK